MKKITLLYIILLLAAGFKFYIPEQLIKTTLQIEVLNELGNFESEARVRLFKNKDDYDKLTNPIGETKLTDAKGKVTFKDLEPIVYYVNVEKGDKNNFGAAEKTEMLQAKRINKIKIVISD